MPADDSRDAGFRYGLVFMLTLTLLVFAILAPAADWSRGARGLPLDHSEPRQLGLALSKRLTRT